MQEVHVHSATHPVGTTVYAVRNGREGHKLYFTWEEAKSNIINSEGALLRSFSTSQLGEAEQWIRAFVAPRSSLAGSSGSPPARSYNFTQTEPDTSSDEMSPSPLVEVGAKPVSYEMTPVLHDCLATQPETETETEYVGSHPPPWLDEIPDEVNSELPEPQLSAEQLTVVRKVMRGENVFFTGSAGTGKSFLLRRIIQVCRETFGREQVAVTASTGIAAENIHGVTLHSWAGIGLGKEPAEVLVGMLLGKHKWKKKEEAAKQRALGLQSNRWDGSDEVKDNDYWARRTKVDKWKSVQTLIIDEISMIDGVFFDKLEYIARELRQDNRPFGGIQLVISGDFYQLPPVAERNWSEGTTLPVCFAFDAKTWNRCVGRPITLTQVFRQKDQEFVAMLNAMRVGKLEPETIAKFKALSRPIIYANGIEPSDLFPVRKEVDLCNNTRLADLVGWGETYEAVDTPGHDEKGKPITGIQLVRVLERMMVLPVIVLKEWAQVMLLKNQTKGYLVNGSVGRIIEFSTTRDAVENQIEVAGYVGYYDRFAGKRKGNQDYLNIPDALLSDKRVWPLVEFDDKKRLLCVPQEFTVHNANGGVAAYRCQVPLQLAWALSIHKSQGQTLKRVRVNLGRVFEKGQGEQELQGGWTHCKKKSDSSVSAYVAISRATSMEDLQVIGFDPMKVMVDKRVVEWMNDQQEAEVMDDLNYLAYMQREGIDETDYDMMVGTDDMMDIESEFEDKMKWI